MKLENKCGIIGKSLTLGSILASIFSGTLFAAEMPSREEMWEIIQKQQAQIDLLTQKVEITGEAIDKVQSSPSSSYSSHSDSHSSTSIGGYGELHYNMGESDTIDFHRFVLLGSHEFSDRIRLSTELEIEHALAGDGKEGEVEIEQAYLEFDLNDSLTAKAGLFLVPVGIINEIHEPNTFFGVERNPIEKNIIPTTWWEAGAGLNAKFDNGFSTDIAVHSGLMVDTDGKKAFNIRSGRQKVSNAEASDGAITGRVKWTGAPGIEVGLTGQYQQDIAQGKLSDDVDATLIELHTSIQRGAFGLRALYARWDLSGEAASAIGADEQFGWYVEPSWTIESDIGEWGVFARLNQYDTSAGSGSDSKVEELDLGINYWPHENVVLKVDYQTIDSDSDGNEDLINLGIGYHF